MTSHQRINADSGRVEYYTPQPIIDAARAVLGGIDLDPASSRAANARVRAARYFTTRGLDLPWQGRVWLNHPYGRGNNAAWISKLVREIESGRVPAACCITFASTSEKWFYPLLLRPQCYLTRRTNFYLSNGKLKRGVTKGSVVTYFGPDVAAFRREFSTYGVIKI